MLKLGPRMVGSLVATTLVSLACSPGMSDFDKARVRLAAGAGAAADETTAAQPTQNLGTLDNNPFGPMGAMLMSRMAEPGPYEEPRHSPEWDEDKAHWAIMDLGGPIVERERVDWFSTETGLELRTIGDRLAELAEREVSGILLRVEDMPLSAATAEELRGILVARQAGEGGIPIHCYSEQASTFTYYVMSACASIAVPINGSLFVAGVGATPLHVRGLLDRFGVEPDFVTVGAYKGAAEALTRTAPSPQMNETIDGILDTAFAALRSGIASGRKLEEARVAELIDRGMFTASEAKEAGLIDAVQSFDGYRVATTTEEGAKVAAWKRYPWVEKEQQGMGQLLRMLGIASSRPTGARIALVYALGNIVDGDGEGILGARSEIASGTLVPALRALGADDSVKAIVLRIDSGGGSALASELIDQAIKEIRGSKPIIVSMGYVAASGGYYIASGANRIFALANTLTGSIGVIGGKLVFGKTMQRYGISAHPRGRGKNVDLFSIVSSWDAQDREAVRAMMKSVYDMFVFRVSSGRKMTQDEVLAVAEGRVWTGSTALGNGLVDEIGGLDAALAHARKLTGLSEDAPLEVYPPEPTLRDFLASIGQVDAGPLRTLHAEVEAAVGPTFAGALLRTVEQVMMFRDARVLTISFVPFVLH